MGDEYRTEIRPPRWAVGLVAPSSISRRDAILHELMERRREAEASILFGALVPSVGAMAVADFELRLFSLAEENGIDFEGANWREQALEQAARQLFALTSPKKRGRPRETAPNRLLLGLGLGGKPGARLLVRAEKILARCELLGISQREACLRQAREDNPGLEEEGILQRAKRYGDQVSVVNRATGNRQKPGRKPKGKSARVKQKCP